MTARGTVRLVVMRLPSEPEPDPPPWMDGEQAEVWRRLAAEVTLTSRDMDTFAMLVANIVLQRKAVALVSSSSLLIKRGEQLVENPALAVARDLGRQVLDLSKRFGLTPGDREAEPEPTPGLRPRRGA